MLENFNPVLILSSVIGGVFIIATIALLAAAIQDLKIRLGGTLSPTLDQVILALTPWLWKAIAAGERSVLWGLEELNRHIDGLDKKAVADQFYNLIPDIVPVPIGNKIIPIPVHVIKRLVTREEFANLVKTLYDQFDMEIGRNIENLKKTLIKRTVEETAQQAAALASATPDSLTALDRASAGLPVGQG